MDPIRTVLVGVDFSENSLHALRRAIHMARAQETLPHVLHVVEQAPIEDLAAVMPMDQDELKSQIHHHEMKDLKEWFDRNDVKVSREPEVAFGSPRHVILERARSLSANLLVLGASGVSGVKHRAGTIAAQCVRNAPTDVLLVRDEGRKPFTQVLACVDFSDISDAVVDQAVAIASRDRARLELLHVHSAPWERVNLNFMSSEDMWNYKQSHLSVIRGRLEQYLVRREAAIAGLDVRCEEYPCQQAWEGVVRYVKNDFSDLVVLGNRGRAGLKDRLLGGTAERVVDEISESVLIVRTPAGHASAPGETPSNSAEAV